MMPWAMCGDRGSWKISVLSFKFCCEPETILKIRLRKYVSCINNVLILMFIITLYSFSFAFTKDSKNNLVIVLILDNILDVSKRNTLVNWKNVENLT